MSRSLDTADKPRYVGDRYELSTRPKRFTLIEILVVVLIIGTTAGFALLAFGDFGAGRRILMAADQVKYTIKLAQQQAILEAGTLGVQLSASGYQVHRFKSPNTWEAISQKGVFKGQIFPKDTVISL